MFDKDPSGASLVTLIWFASLAMLGGLAAFIQKLNNRSEPLPLLSIFLRLCGELVVSGFTGIATFYLCQYWSFDNSLTAFCVAISGHMGGRAIEKLENIYDNWLHIDKNLPPKE